MWKNLRKKLDLPESYISISLGFLVILVAGILTYNYFVKNQAQKTDTSQNQTSNGNQKTQEGKKLDLPATYQVKKGDTLWKIAENQYGSGYNWVTIVEANKLANPDQIEEGQKLSLPEAEVIKPGESNILAAQAPPKEYKVSSADSLWKIAEREYGSGYEWTKIAQYNNLSNPDLIYAGTVLKLPR